jgi:segregation and condensation protein A
MHDAHDGTPMEPDDTAGTEPATDPAPGADLSVESPAVREREGGAVVRPARAPVTFKLERFEGPLDLLLHLIKRDELDIFDIPIAHITQQYLATLEIMRQLDLEVSGDFLVMAATLMRIKAKMLLPLPASGDGEEDEGDPREELVQRLLEYRQYKEAAEQMKDKESFRRLLHARGMVPSEDDAGPLPLAKVSLFDLLEALNRVMARRPAAAPVYAVQTEGWDIDDKMSLIARTVAEEGRLLFSTLVFHARARMEIVVSFMALLELVKLGHVRVEQDDAFEDIVILPGQPQGRDTDAPVATALGD